jgi:hypothetical protein
MKQNPDNMIFRKTWWQSIQIMPVAARAEIFESVCKYVFEGIEPQLDPMSAVCMALSFIKRDIDEDKKRYADVCAKRAEAGRRHSGNQYTRQQPVQLEQTGTNGTNGSNNNCNSNCNGNNKENKENEKDISFSFSQKKEKIIFEFALLLLSEGRPNAYTEARDAYDYNDATEWTSETVLPNGNVQKKKISNKLSWLRGWKRTNEQIFAPADGVLFAECFDGIESLKQENECIINQFRGIRGGDETITLCFVSQKAIRIFKSTFETNAAFNKKVCLAIHKRFPKAEIIDYKTI